ncbi:MAG: hypothetical protein QF752_16290 [Planctomycetota bacterium]|nr:hypothetical protein [Planctomycetota bacterium]
MSLDSFLRNTPSEVYQREPIQHPQRSDMEVIRFLPRDIEETQTIVSFCHDHKIQPITDPWALTRAFHSENPWVILNRPLAPDRIVTCVESLRTQCPVRFSIARFEESLGRFQLTCRPGILSIGSCPLSYTIERGGLGPIPGFPSPFRGFLLGQCGMTPEGAIFRSLPVPRSATGSTPGVLLSGGANRFGFLISVHLEVRRIPDRIQWLAFQSPSWKSLLSDLRQICRPGPELHDMIVLQTESTWTLLACASGTRRGCQASVQIARRWTQNRLSPVDVEQVTTWTTPFREASRTQEARIEPFDPVPGWTQWSCPWEDTSRAVTPIQESSLPWAWIRPQPQQVDLVCPGPAKNRLPEPLRIRFQAPSTLLERPLPFPMKSLSWS